MIESVINNLILDRQSPHSVCLDRIIWQDSVDQKLNKWIDLAWLMIDLNLVNFLLGVDT